jgi:hypothetical protein
LVLFLLIIGGVVGGVTVLVVAVGRAAALGHPLFDQRFRVETADPRAAHALLSPALVEATCAARRRSGASAAANW